MAIIEPEGSAAMTATRDRTTKRRPRAGSFTMSEYVPPLERAAQGLAARAEVPPERHAEFEPPKDRVDPVSLLEKQAESRVPELVPIRHGRMLLSPFTFYRGAAAVMAADLAYTPVSGLTVQLCGDAHLTNFGVFGSPERNLIFDINDFDETYPGPWEWDLKRLAASLVVAGRENGFSTKERRTVVRSTARRYVAAMSRFAPMSELAVWYARADMASASEILSKPVSKTQAKKLGKAGAKARSRDSVQAYGKMVRQVNGHHRIIGVPPLIVPVADLLPDTDREALELTISGLLSRYRRTLPSDRRVLLDRYWFADMARKVVGVGSVGTRCWAVLLHGRDESDPLFLQVKEAQQSVIAEHVKAKDLPVYRNEGERVVAGQWLMQAVSDIFLGWENVEGIDGMRRDFYVRQLRDWKGSAVPEAMAPNDMARYGEICAWSLARAHARSGDRIAIASYLGDDDAFPRAIAKFAEAYADQNELDHAALAEAGRTGRIEVQPGL
jgi:uncharacterized protein (DUF2252 family)